MNRFFMLMLMLFAGVAIAQTPANLLARAANGEAKAMMELSEKYRFGMGVEQREDSADYWVKKAVETGDPDALYLRGVELTTSIFSGKKFGEGVALLKKAGEKSHPDALLKLSEIYRRKDTGTENDSYYSQTKAFAYAQKAADAGSGEAVLYCGDALLNGTGTTANDSLGIAYIKSAADTYKMPEAQIRMGNLLLEGTRIGARDLDASVAYFRAARDNARASLEMKTDALVGIHEVDIVFKRTHNLMMQSTGLLPQGAFYYPLQAD